MRHERLIQLKNGRHAVAGAGTVIDPGKKCFPHKRDSCIYCRIDRVIDLKLTGERGTAAESTELCVYVTRSTFLVEI